MGRKDSPPREEGKKSSEGRGQKEISEKPKKLKGM